jgi:hypothetical protein
MAHKQDQLFPSASIGRVQGARLGIQRTTSHEILAAHPLLSPNNANVQLGEPTQGGSATTSNSNDPPRYVPYTPRQRATPTSATTGTTTVHQSVSTSSQQYQGDATSKLQLMNLKAAAQNVGLDTGTVGWVMLEKLVNESDHGAEWTDIWNSIVIGKVRVVSFLQNILTVC